MALFALTLLNILLSSSVISMAPEVYASDCPDSRREALSRLPLEEAVGHHGVRPECAGRKKALCATCEGSHDKKKCQEKRDEALECLRRNGLKFQIRRPTGRCLIDYGHLVGGSKLETSVCLKILRGREDQIYGTTEMVNAITSVAQKTCEQFDKPLWILKVAHRDGGDDGESSSHQNGLDTDILIPNVNGDENRHSGTDYGIHADLIDIDRTFLMLEELVKTGRASLILVNQPIKQSLCKELRKRGGGSRELRYALMITKPNTKTHHNHFHVRLKCEVGSTTCKDANDPPRPLDSFGPGEAIPTGC